LAFGFWDAVAPLVGIPIGHYLGQAIGSAAEYVAAIALGAYGLYLLMQAGRTAAPEELERPWALFGLPLPLSLDNVAAGTSLGLLGFSPWVAAPVFGAITVLMSFVGLQLTGVALIAMATVVGLGLES
jgi:putative Mn2+ efflux pump MntP